MYQLLSKYNTNVTPPLVINLMTGIHVDVPTAEYVHHECDSASCD